MKKENGVKTAKVKATGEVVNVYRLKNGNWCNYADCKTEYLEKDLELTKENE